MLDLRCLGKYQTFEKHNGWIRLGLHNLTSLAGTRENQAKSLSVAQRFLGSWKKRSSSLAEAAQAAEAAEAAVKVDTELPHAPLTLGVFSKCLLPKAAVIRIYHGLRLYMFTFLCIHEIDG